MRKEAPGDDEYQRFLQAADENFQNSLQQISVTEGASMVLDRSPRKQAILDDIHTWIDQPLDHAQTVASATPGQLIAALIGRLGHLHDINESEARYIATLEEQIYELNGQVEDLSRELDYIHNNHNIAPVEAPKVQS